ncbi:lipid-A-disaccharide synthase [Halothiobacillus neapolitanus]|uniref:Lipid-A-disaccharide synthase n=1 Tax=Halothiobacillus neapolitanus (strain ATCC 23641 / DSM 15147 / CIP 104769 / NCIMB 8539 / c2) TaxID=555778 RepID=D0L037_HALNC|nr:lipid-A-disaccharide synthase [Halothiobacillus neapolitanus]ACX96060.1 lipid-A-disaccharide synthase [Halothiobacillus neapolitanus c2]TDN66368.1 lipid-A-disaccharide synthase [Halothiobacillus neapolitanus]
MTDSLTPSDMRPLRLFFAAGEASGDHYAAELFQRLNRLRPGSVAQGLGGTESRAAGIDTIVDLNTVSVMGLVEVLKQYGQLKQALNTLIDAMIVFKPDILIAIDFQEFNQRLAKAARAHGIKVLFFVAPQVWAWRPKRAAKFSEVADHLAVLFDFEVPLFARYGLPTTHVGHPLRDMIPPESCKTATTGDAVQAKARHSLGIAPAAKLIGLLPGSRRSEISRLLSTQLASAQRLLKVHPDLLFALPIADSIDPVWFGQELAKCAISSDLRAKLSLANGHAREVMAASDALIIASGTATLEAALIGTPMVIVYKTHPITYWLAKHLVHIERIGLPNIVLNRNAFPELIQNAASPEAIANEISILMLESESRASQNTALAEIPSHLGEPGALAHLAQLVLDLTSDTPAATPPK